ncbi:MAG: glycosyltransferase family 1 protein [Pyrinomonadaceae bacterium]
MAQKNGTIMYPNEMIKVWLANNTREDQNAVDAERNTRPAEKPPDALDVVCLSHLRWDFVYQRPQHLLSRAARGGRVFFVEEPVFENGSMRLEISERDCGVRIVVPRLPEGLHSEIATEAVLRQMLDRLIANAGIREYVLWYYTPMALEFTRHLKPAVTVYDCMDELSAFKGAPQHITKLERELFSRADLVFTGGQSLYEVKREQHPSVHAFPSSIDRDHFAQARSRPGPESDPEDQADIPNPRFGFFGVVDERFDVELLASVAKAKPDWHFVIVGPVVKIDPNSLPRGENIHYLGSKAYKDLPAYVAGWDVAMLLFARNDATRFISPTKTPEYLAAGKPVISTSIRDVVRPYGDRKLVEIADTPGEFINAAERLLSSHDRKSWLADVDGFLSQTSWDSTWSDMWALIERVGTSRRRKAVIKSPAAALRKAGAAGAIGVA